MTGVEKYPVMSDLMEMKSFENVFCTIWNKILQVKHSYFIAIPM